MLVEEKRTDSDIFVGLVVGAYRGNENGNFARR